MAEPIQAIMEELLIEYTPVDLAEKLKCSTATISKYKHGKMQPSKRAAYYIYKEFGRVVTPFSEEGILSYAEQLLFKDSNND